MWGDKDVIDSVSVPPKSSKYVGNGRTDEVLGHGHGHGGIQSVKIHGNLFGAEYQNPFTNMKTYKYMYACALRV